MAQWNWDDLRPLALNDKDLVQVPWMKYYKEKYPKKQIVLHHTVSGPGIDGDMNTWKTFKDHISTCVIIERNGKINQLFNSAFWGYHLGCGRKDLDKGSIAVELDSWGQVREKNGEFYTYYGSKLAKDVPLTHYPDGFRGEKYFEAYSYEQLKSLGELLLLWGKNYGIPLAYNEDMWDVSQRALNASPGVWSHVSFRPYPEKSDVHPDPNLVSLLQTLNKITY